jgi:hypothetical protein
MKPLYQIMVNRKKIEFLALFYFFLYIITALKVLSRDTQAEQTLEIIKYKDLE